MEVEKLYTFIKEETEKYALILAQLGENNPITKAICSQIYGMQQAFEVVAGVSYTDYLLAKM